MTLAELQQTGVSYLLASGNVATATVADGLSANSATWSVTGPRGKATLSMSIFDGTDSNTWQALAQSRWDTLIAWMGQ